MVKPYKAKTWTEIGKDLLLTVGLIMTAPIWIPILVIGVCYFSVCFPVGFFKGYVRTHW
jgi:hypothetical protein